MLRGEKHDFIVSCEMCGRGLYRVRSDRVALVRAEQMTVCPIVVVVKERQHIFCDGRCASYFFTDTPDHELRAGYPLFWGATPEPALESRRPTDDRGGSS